MSGNFRSHLCEVNSCNRLLADMPRQTLLAMNGSGLPSCTSPTDLTDGPVTKCRPFRGAGDDTDVMRHVRAEVKAVDDARAYM